MVRSITTGNGISRLDITTGEAEEILNWNQTDVNREMIQMAKSYPVNKDEINVLVTYSHSETGRDTCYIIHLTRASTNPHAGKKILRMAGTGIRPEIYGLIYEYNADRNNPARIETVDYLIDYDSDNTSGLSVTDKIYLDMMEGNSPDILLISTHGFFYNDIQEAIKVPYLQKRQNALNPMTTTGLILADGERAWQGEPREDECDNILSSQEVASMNLTGTQLAVLSACETGLGASNMEGVYGLQRGFKQAGVRSLCASLWSVNDLSTAQLMQSFFRQWLSGKKGMTMQQAMITAMKEQRARTPEPYYWAPFVIYDADF